jgi:phage-related protein
MCYIAIVWELVFFRTESGRVPVREFLDDLSVAERARVIRDLETLKAFGLELNAPLVKSIKGKLWELRTTGRNQHRILYFAVSGKRLVLLHGFTKKTQKTPAGEITKALRRMAIFQRDEKHG